jgi:hypothetical protein
MKGVSSLIRRLFHPPPNSITLYTHLVKITMPLTVNATKKPRNLPLALNFLYSGVFQLGYLLTLSKKSMQAIPNKIRDTIWKIRPASMRWFPSSMVLCFVAAEATPPPAPCRDREMISQAMKKRVYQMGLTREMDWPYTMTLGRELLAFVGAGREGRERTFVIGRGRCLRSRKRVLL